MTTAILSDQFSRLATDISGLGAGGVVDYLFLIEAIVLMVAALFCIPLHLVLLFSYA